MKRLFAFLIACVLLIGMLPLDVMAAGETVYRVFGANRYATSTLIADKLKEDAGVDRFGSVIVASGANFPDALAGSYLAAVTGAPIILVNKGTVDMDWFSANVASGANVYILGGEAAVSGKAENQLAGYAVERLAGSNRYETNLIILRKAMELGGSTRDILVCTGGNFADSLSASATGKAILLVNKSLNEEQKAFLTAAGCENIYVLGGTAAVSEKIQSSLTSYGSVTRISGNTRYETSVKIAETFFPGATNAVVAYAKNFPDGLCGGPLAICMGSPLILTNTGSEAMATAYANQAGIHAGVVLGGTGLISDSTVKKIFGLNETIIIPFASADCKHNWQTNYHPELGHYGDYYNLCICGFVFNDPNEWETHVMNAGADAPLYHTSWGSTRDYIIDSPEYTEWICTKCGITIVESGQYDPLEEDTSNEPKADSDSNDASSDSADDYIEDYGDCLVCGRKLWTSSYPSGCFTFLVDTVCECGQLVRAMECHHH